MVLYLLTLVPFFLLALRRIVSSFTPHTILNLAKRDLSVTRSDFIDIKSSLPMQLLTRTSLPQATSASSDEPVAFQDFVANDKYIVVCLSNATVYALSSTTGALLQETPFVHPVGYVSRPILDGDTIILCSPSDVNLTVYSIPQQ